MFVRLDNEIESLVSKEAKKRNLTNDELIRSLILQRFGKVKDTPFATIYDTADGWEPRFDSISGPEIDIDKVALDLARDQMIARMRRDDRSTASELSPEEARARYIERLKRKRY